MRIFIALDLSRKTINTIKEIQRLLKRKKLFDGKLTDPENLHLTLKFLGEIDEQKIEEVKKRLKEVRFDNFEAELGEVGVFSSRYRKDVRVIWILLKNCKKLQKKIDESLKDLFEPEFRFMSHITIARIKRVYDRIGFLEYIKKIKVSKMKFKVDRFFLKKSELFEAGPIYEDIEEYKLD